jgi:ABC-type multidrug transport system ATPase subunit
MKIVFFTFYLSGKTTFLSALALRLDPYRMDITGNIHMNGATYTKHQLKSMAGYVMQVR